jgi:hypothetical protein
LSIAIDQLLHGHVSNDIPFFANFNRRPEDEAGADRTLPRRLSWPKSSPETGGFRVSRLLDDVMYLR